MAFLFAYTKAFLREEGGEAVCKLHHCVILSGVPRDSAYAKSFGAAAQFDSAFASLRMTRGTKSKDLAETDEVF